MFFFLSFITESMLFLRSFKFKLLKVLLLELTAYVLSLEVLLELLLGCVLFLSYISDLIYFRVLLSYADLSFSLSATFIVML